jgi:heat shock protein HslJ
MAEEVDKTTEKSISSEKKKQKNIAVLFAIAILVGVGAYYFVNQKNISQSENVKAVISKAAENINTDSDATAESTSELTSQKWTWVNTKMSDGKVTTPSKAGAFTATFQDDGRLVAMTDCNNGNGAYEVGEDNSLTIGPFASTMMFCEGSTEGDYFKDLQNVGSYKIENGQLWLMLKMDSGTMIFE